MTDPIDPADLRQVDVADVLKSGVLAGRLRRTHHDVVFTYLPEYLAGDAPAVASTLPRTEVPATGSAGAVPPFFAGLLPEGVRLQAVVTATRTSVDDHLTLLLAVGADVIGDVQVVPVGTAPVQTSPLTVDDASGLDLTQAFLRATSSDPEQMERLALPGVQAKVSAAMISTPVSTTAGPAILKINPRDQPHLVRNEHFFLDLAKACGMPTPTHRLVTDRSGVDGLLVARFDRTPADGGWKRLEQEDGCQLLDVYPAAKYRVRTEDVIRAAARWVEDGGGSSRLAVRRLLELVAVSYLVGNGDLHGKNFSARRGPDGPREVTPVYDLLSTQPYLGWRDPMALNLYGRANRIDRRHLLESASRLGLPGRALVSSLERICSAAAPFLERLDTIGFSERETGLLRDLLAGRLRQLRGEHAP